MSSISALSLLCSRSRSWYRSNVLYRRSGSYGTPKLRAMSSTSCMVCGAWTAVWS